MDSKTDFLTRLQQQIFEAFESQDPELFDTVFEIDGKKLYADKLRLSIASSTFKSMLSKQWNPKNEAIEILNCNYANFKGLLTFIYCGEYQISDSNIFDTLDMAAFYQIDYLKQICEEYLAKMEINFRNIFQFLEISNKYSLIYLKEVLYELIYENYDIFIKNDERFLNVDKSVIEELMSEYPNLFASECFFPKVYQWIEKHVVKNQRESDDEDFDKNDAIKTELISFAKCIPNKKSKMDFLDNYGSMYGFKNWLTLNFLVANGIQFSEDELKGILSNAKSNPVEVKITNSYGHSISGVLPPDSSAVEIIKALKNRTSENQGNFMLYWTIECKALSTPSKIKKRKGIDWYLIFFSDKCIGVGNYNDLKDDSFLLAELIPEKSGFEITHNCKIEIVE